MMLGQRDRPRPALGLGRQQRFRESGGTGPDEIAERLVRVPASGGELLGFAAPEDEAEQVRHRPVAGDHQVEQPAHGDQRVPGYRIVHLGRAQPARGRGEQRQHRQGSRRWARRAHGADDRRRRQRAPPSSCGFRVPARSCRGRARGSSRAPPRPWPGSPCDREPHRAASPCRRRRSHRARPDCRRRRHGGSPPLRARADRGRAVPAPPTWGR